ncbi:hypothetical protein EVAR_69365_1, partial [Eumeta japonica]
QTRRSGKFTSGEEFNVSHTRTTLARLARHAAHISPIFELERRVSGKPPL